MNLIEAAHSVNRSEENSNSVDPEELMRVMDLDNLRYDYGGIVEDFKEYWLVCWLCTDTHVGVSVGFFKDKAVYVRNQTGRKSRPTFKFIGEGSYQMVREGLMKHVSVNSEFQVVGNDDEIADFYSVNYSRMILEKNAYYKGKPVTLSVQHSYNIVPEILVKINETGEEVMAPVTDLKFKIRQEPDK